MDPELLLKLRRVGEWDDDVDGSPIETPSFTHGDYQLVGHGEVTNDYCGKFRGHLACSRVELHNRITLEGQDFRGKVYRKPVFYSCDKPSCPKCYKYGWAVREARRIEARLREASKRFGLVEHIVASVPVRDYGLSHDGMCKKAYRILAVRGVIGGATIVHAFRYNLRRSWYFSPHFHCLGFVLGGYARCRNCSVKWNCRAGCGGFDDRSWQHFLKDGWYVKVLGKRISVFHTCLYLLNHASIDVTKNRFHVVRWFGVASYRKLRVKAEERKKAVCMICKQDLVLHYYFGSKRFVLDRESPDFEWSSLEDLMENGQRVWVEREPERYG